MITFFGAPDPPPVGRVGGKAHALMQLTAQGFPVPPGFVLETGFFDAWTEILTGTPGWRAVLAADDGRLRAGCEELERRCADLSLDAGRRQTLREALANLGGTALGRLYAVRSSSPEEDLGQASFAGAYGTVLAVPPTEIESAVRACFTSLFDERIYRYRMRRGLAPTTPRLAVIVQELVDAEVAGIAFSLNPLNNCYDEAVVNANFGLAATVVSGDVDPDEFVYDRVARSVVGRRIGSKEYRLSAVEGGGIARHSGCPAGVACLSQRQIEGIVDLAAAVEAKRGEPVDIEWAMVGDRISLLQARPITTYLPLPRLMVTRPGEPKRLYSNSGLIEQGLQEPLSVLGTDFLALVLGNVGGPMAEGAIGHDGLTFTADGGYYLNVSYAYMVGMRNAALAPGNFGDPQVMAILDGIDMSAYTQGELPPRMRALRRSMLWRALPIVGATIAALLRPRQVLKRYQSALPKEDRRLDTFRGEGMSLRARAEALTKLLRFFYGDHGIPMILAAQLAQRRIKALFARNLALASDHLVSLGIALPGNKTTEMGERLHALAASPEVGQFETAEAFRAALDREVLDPAFVRRWRDYMAEFGMRCPREVDPATPRPSESPERLFDQLTSLAPAADGAASFLTRARARREASHRALLDIARKRSRACARAFERSYATWLTFGGYRETPKHYVIKVVALFRSEALAIASDLVAAGRLDSPDRIFDLTLDDVDRGLADPSVDLRALGRERAAPIERIRRSRLTARILDSRGRIFFPLRADTKDGVLAGIAISPGVAKGRVRVLGSAGAKRVFPGEILVTRAADPGWTPLFINAAGIVLEIGGALQHGAVVAREYGIPCVSGVENATEVLRDGQVVTVDGSSGIVRICDGEATP